MNKIRSILALSAAVSLFGCAESDHGMASDQDTMNQPERVSNAPRGNYNSSFSVGDAASSNTNPPVKAPGNLVPDTQPGLTADSNSPGPQLDTGSDKTKLSVALSGTDRAFMQTANSGGMYEVQAGQKAVAKTSDDHIKSIGQRMIDDHSKSNQQLSALARRKGVELSSLPNADQIKMLAKLDSLNGGEFDREYLKQQREAHLDTIAAFQAEIRDGADRDTKDWAAATLPGLREHLQMIEGDLKPALGSER